MKHKRLTARLFAFILSFLIILSSLVILLSATGTEQTTESDKYRRMLMVNGFPEDYADKLTALHEMHPAWTFTPLWISEDTENTKGVYTWDYVLKMETTDNVKRSLVSGSATYSAYRHETNKTLYDSGWYQASTATVSYFMDPRNFLNEKDIFQFQNLSYTSGSVTKEAIDTALSGTFMASGTLMNGMSYADYFLELGDVLGVDPIHLAARVRQEQGVSGGPQISGLCGDKLAYYYENKIQEEDGRTVYAPSSGYSTQQLKSYNGLYNFYNIGAAGTGYFQIFLGAMKEAQTGTPDMSVEWGGPQWDTDWKALYGGAYKLKTKYIDDYQNTLYLQKFNVDYRSSRNFWGQYMQNISGAFSEARTLYNSLVSSGCLELPFNFLIPVYDNIPDSCPDPAGGKCDTYRLADTYYSTVSGLFLSDNITPATDGYVNTVISDNVISGEKFTLSGWSVCTSAISEFEYSVDCGEWHTAEGLHDDGISAQYKADFRASTLSSSVNAYKAEIATDTLDIGRHTVAVRAQLKQPGSGCLYFLSSCVDFDIVQPPETTVITTEETTVETTAKTEDDSTVGTTAEETSQDVTSEETEECTEPNAKTTDLSEVSGAVAAETSKSDTTTSQPEETGCGGTVLTEIILIVMIYLAIICIQRKKYVFTR